MYAMTPEGSLTLSICGKEKGKVSIRLGDPPMVLLPPRTVEANMVLGNDTFRITQNEKRCFELFSHQTRIGQISDILNYRVLLEVSTEIPAERIALLYALSQRMLHEDNVDIV